MAARAACWAVTVAGAAAVDWEAPAAQSVPLAAMTVMEAVVAVPVEVMAATAAPAVQMEALEVEEARAGGWSWATRGSYIEPSPLPRRRAAARRARLVGATFVATMMDGRCSGEADHRAHLPTLEPTTSLTTSQAQAQATGLDVWQDTSSGSGAPEVE